MEFIYKDTSINYVFYDNKSNSDLIFLHGWGQNIEMMNKFDCRFIKGDTTK